MPVRETISDVRSGIEALVASTEAGAPPPTGAGLSAAIMGRLRTGLERILRRQLAHQQVTQLETLYLVHDLSTSLAAELLGLRQMVAEVAHLTSEARAAQTSLEHALAKLEDRAQLTESLTDELTAAMDGSRPGAEPGRSAAVSR